MIIIILGCWKVLGPIKKKWLTFFFFFIEFWLKSLGSLRKTVSNLLNYGLDIICLNFWDEDWCVLFWLWFFELLSSFLLLLKHISDAVSSGLCQMSLVYLGIEMIQPGESQTSKMISQVKSNFYTQINKGHLRKAGTYSSQNIGFQLTTIKMRTKVWKITTKIIWIRCVE